VLSPLCLNINDNLFVEVFDVGGKTKANGPLTQQAWLDLSTASGQLDTHMMLSSMHQPLCSDVGFW
jgi:hypothetical protein